MKKYQAVAEQLIKNINEGKYQDKKLPTEDELVLEYKASKNTIRAATDLLVERGMLFRVQGSGVYVRETESDNAINASRIRGIFNEFQGSAMRTEVLNFELIESDEELSTLFQTELGTPLYRINRIRYVDDVPFTLEYSLYNKNVIPYIGLEIANASIFEYIEKDLKLKIGFADKFVSVELMDEEHAQHLGFKAGDPSLIINEKIYLANGVLFNVSKVYHNYQKVDLFISATN